MRGFSEPFEDLLQLPQIEPRYSIALSFDDDSINDANQNLLLRSQTFTHADWTQVGPPVVTDNAVVAPDGTTTAATLEDNGAGYEYIYQATTAIDIAKVYTFSLFIKKDAVGRATRFPYLNLRFTGSTGEDNAAGFDTSTGDVSLITQDSDQVVATCEDYDGDYWRVRVSAVSNDTANTTATVYIYPAVGASASWAQSAAATGEITIWGAQLSESPSALEYIATTTPAATAGSSDSDVTWLTSHADALVLPGVGSADRLDSVIEARGISGTMQRIKFDTGKHTIGAITIRILDDAGAFSDKINAKLVAGEGLRRKRIRLYMGHSAATDWVNYYAPIFTFIIDSVEYLDAVYTLKCSDIQRTAKTRIFELHQGGLTATVSANAETIPITIDDAENKFPTVFHDSAYAAQPSATVGYIKIDDEIICHSGWNGGFTELQVVKRGALGTDAAKHKVTATESSKKKKTEEYVYLQMPAPKLLYAILTGVLHGDSASLPAHWHLGMPLEFVDLDSFTDIGDDLWTVADNQGRRVQFAGIEGTEAKKFYEGELLLWCNCFLAVTALGELKLERIPAAAPASPYDDHLTAALDVSKYGALRHDMKSLINSSMIHWNWIDTLNRFTKRTGRIDADSITKHGASDLKIYKFRGVFTGTNSDSDVFNFFVALRDNFANPSLLINIEALPEWIRLEVGDTIRLTLPGVRDFNSTTTLDRVFAITSMKIDWISGKVEFELFGGVEKTAETTLSESNVLADSYYTTGGTELSTVLTISAGAVTASGSLTGAANNTDAIFYYDGDLTINAGVTISTTRNILLRVKGFLTWNGAASIAGNSADGAVGKTRTGASVGVTVRHSPQDNVEIGSLPGKYKPNKRNSGKFKNGVPVLNVLNPDGLTLKGVPKDLSGVKGLTGPAARINNIDAFTNPPTFDRSAAGGAGGAGGGSLTIVCRGMSLGINAQFTTDGAAGSAGSLASSDDAPTIDVRGQTGAGGFPGVTVVLIDGDYSAPDFTSANFEASRGAQAIPGTVDQYLGEPLTGYLQPGEEGYGQNLGTDTFNYWQSCTRIQYIPPAENGFTWTPANERKETPDVPNYDRDLSILQLDNWYEMDIGVTEDLAAIAFGVNSTIPGGRFCAVGSGTTDPTIVRSDTGESWIEVSNSLGVLALSDIVFAEDIFVACGHGGVIATSTEGATWTSRTTPGTENRYAIAHGNDGYFCSSGVASGTDMIIWHSTDAITWVENVISASHGQTLNGIVHGNGIWCAVGRSDGTRPQIFTATDPTGTWTERTAPAIDVHLQDVAYGNGVWIAVGADVPADSAPLILISTDDCATWTQVTTALPDELDASNDLIGIEYLNGLFIMVGQNTLHGHAAILTTPDGESDYLLHPNAKSNALYGIAYGRDMYVAVGLQAGSTKPPYVIRSVRR